MRNVFSTILTIAGIAVILFAGYEFFQHKMSTKAALERAEQLVVKDDEKKEEMEFIPVDNEVVGLLQIPKIEERMPVIEGTDEEMLEQGVGHYNTTAFPGENEQILVSGHRDTIFRRFDELEIGDRFIMQMPYGEFEYEFKDFDIVDADDRTVIRPMGEEVLTISTCYPFNYVGSAPDRFIIYAYPVDSEEDVTS